jgi:hypothetical protein
MYGLVNISVKATSLEACSTEADVTVSTDEIETKAEESAPAPVLHR